MTEEQIETEVNREFDKEINQLAKDVIREANTLPKNPAPEKANLDLIKHLLKRIAVHQLIIEEQVFLLGKLRLKLFARVYRLYKIPEILAQ